MALHFVGDGDLSLHELGGDLGLRQPLDPLSPPGSCCHIASAGLTCKEAATESRVPFFFPFFFPATLIELLILKKISELHSCYVN